MKLRRRLALAFAAATCLTVISAFGLTLAGGPQGGERVRARRSDDDLSEQRAEREHDRVP